MTISDEMQALKIITDFSEQHTRSCLSALSDPAEKAVCPTEDVRAACAFLASLGRYPFDADAADDSLCRQISQFILSLLNE